MDFDNHAYLSAEGTFFFLESIGVKPNKSLSQNFLVDGNIIRKFVSAADVQPGDFVLEIGPGPGSLTEVLLNAGAHVLAVEKDLKLADALERFQGKGGSLKVVKGDILKCPLAEILTYWLPKGAKAKVIGNLPYHITTPILTLLLHRKDLFTQFTFMVLEEVARKCIAKPRTPDYSSFTLFLQFFTEPRYQFRVGNKCFYPVPKVDSAIINLQLITPPAINDPDAFFRFARTAFGQRRKMLRSSLTKLYPKEMIIKALGAIPLLSPDSRPEELSLQQFILLYNILNSFNC